jgi:hypothetical protein
VHDLTPVANFRTRVEAELAAKLLEGANLPFVIDSSESAQYGPLGIGTTIFVRAEDAERARELLDEEPDTDSPRTPNG